MGHRTLPRTAQAAAPAAAPVIAQATPRATAVTPAPRTATEPVRPAAAAPLPHGETAVGGVPLTELADRFGTPAYILDEAEVRRRCRAYLRAFAGADVYYTARAFLCHAMVHWVREEGLGLAVCSAGELEPAVTTGFPPERMVLHGNARSPDGLRAGLRLGVGRIVIGSTTQIARLAAAVPAGSRQKVLIRVVPGIAAGGQARLRAGTDHQKSGLSLADGSAQHAITRVLGQPRLELVGLHCHLGSQITTAKPYLSAVRRLIGLLARIHDQHGVVLTELNLGGGHGIAHRPGEPALDIATLGVKIRAELAGGCATAGLPVPRLAVEPGRAIAGPAGVVLYRVLAVQRSGGHTFVAVDAGMSDTPRPALYGVRSAPRLVGRASPAAPEPVTVVGRHCDGGDVLAADVPLPGDIRPGDLLSAALG
ncbi:putative diaminopimelate decarboxylase [Streptomyces sp. NBRC 110611]|uniref:diaminopimelate decarboxylase n=1 Tax=Streptomyces sp. NBRC 110611 TaxID=1621259 RepID=UPI0008563DB5|nr:diaminopimelate decarboxylase [Streptomyces sp. NBRC 110611]GAU66812.1 putative diaminopimelate decarboxylase [Streptomyces sp. NBRC 110611]